MDKKLFIPILLGTKRIDRKSENVAIFLKKKIEEHPDINTQLFDVRQMNFDGTEGEDLKEQNPEFRDAVAKGDGLIVIAPEYNHGYPGSLKMALDMLLKEYIHKVVGLVGVSAGGFGGTRLIESLLSVVRELGLVVTFSDLNFSKINSIFDDDGQLIDNKWDKRVDSFLEELVWMAKTMRWGRKNLSSKFDKK